MCVCVSCSCSQNKRWPGATSHCPGLGWALSGHTSGRHERSLGPRRPLLTTQQPPQQWDEAGTVTDVLEAFHVDAHVVQGHQHQPERDKGTVVNPNTAPGHQGLPGQALT